MADAEHTTAVGALTGDQRALWDALVEINGQDAYDGLVAGIGKVNKNQWLVLPEGFNIPNVEDDKVGHVSAHAGISQANWLQIYHLNRAVAPPNTNAAKFALLRLEAVKAGWLMPGSTFEVRRMSGSTVLYITLTPQSIDLSVPWRKLGTVTRSTVIYLSELPSSARFVRNTLDPQAVSNFR